MPEQRRVYFAPVRGLMAVSHTLADVERAAYDHDAQKHNLQFDKRRVRFGLTLYFFWISKRKWTVNRLADLTRLREVPNQRAQKFSAWGHQHLSRSKEAPLVLCGLS